ncbi:MAG: galactose mutarotase [Oscillospiraceae bacterium]|nr:galactose mutarotase [Oscillospiraceae bacterium]
MSITVFPFSESRLGPVTGYRLSSSELTVTVLSLGGIVHQILYRGKDLVCGFDSADAYLNSSCYYGAVIGRCCNRMRSLRIGGTEYALSRNEKGTNQLHGGFTGFDKKIWHAEMDGDRLSLTYLSPDGEEGFPGNLQVRVTYQVTDSALSIRYEAISDRDTAVNLTNHSYFNLDGIGGTVLDHRLFLDADRISVCDDLHIPTGDYLPCEGTPFDFRASKPIGRDIRTPHPQLTPWGGYDNNFLLQKPSPGDFSLAARAEGKEIGMQVWTDRSCVQLYTSNDEHDAPMKNGTRQIRHRAFCLETQEEPNGVNLGGSFLPAGAPYEAATTFRFYPISDQ